MNPYLGFKDNAREAMEFYRSVFGGSLQINTYKDFGMPQAPGAEDKIMHARLEGENGIVLMATDMLDRMEVTAGSNISISLSGDDEPLLSEYFKKLAEGGVVMQPLEKATWGDTFGMFNDKFGITWLVNISAGQS
jgi:PhnB protein